MIFTSLKAEEHYSDVIMRDDISNHRRLHCLLNFISDADQRKHQSSASLAFCEGNSPITGEFHTQKVSYAETISI